MSGVRGLFKSLQPVLKAIKPTSKFDKFREVSPLKNALAELRGVDTNSTLNKKKPASTSEEFYRLSLKSWKEEQKSDFPTMS